MWETKTTRWFRRVKRRKVKTKRLLLNGNRKVEDHRYRKTTDGWYTTRPRKFGSNKLQKKITWIRGNSRALTVTAKTLIEL